MARRLAATSLLAAVGFATATVRAHPAIAPGAGPLQGDRRALHPSVHEAELGRHAHQSLRDADLAPPGLAPLPPPPPRPAPPRSQQLVRAVYGYYPFWVADLSTIRWEGLTHLAWFSVEIDGDGQITATHGWPDDEAVAAAHAGDVRVELTFTLFDDAQIAALCASPTRRAATVATMVAAMEEGNADGISVDFEFVPASARDDFVTFVAELRAALDSSGHPDAGITLALPEVDWTGAIDLGGLLEHADYAFLMGYGFFWSGSTRAGPPGILRVADEFVGATSWSTIRSIASYSRSITAEQRRQVIWGVPYYGREWITSSSAVAASVVDSVGAVTYSASLDDLDAGMSRQWHAGIRSPYYVWQEGAEWHQVYYEDGESLGAKYDLALDQDLGGIGIWALNYDAPHAELWDLLEQTFSAEPLPQLGDRLEPIAITTFPFRDERDTSQGPSSYFNYYSCAPDTPEYGREWVYRLDLCQSGTLTASVPDYADRDPDLHLLDGPTQQQCLARAHTDLEVALEPGAYWLVLDTFVDIPVELEGPTTLDVDFTAEPGTEPCAGYLVCSAGECICPVEGEVECDGACVDLTRDPSHCGQCGNPCAEDESCTDGGCVPNGAGGSGGVGGAGDGGAVEPAVVPGVERDDASCACRIGQPRRPSNGLGVLSSLGALAAWLARRRCYRPATGTSRSAKAVRTTRCAQARTRSPSGIPRSRA